MKKVRVRNLKPIWKKSSRLKQELNCQHGVGHGGVHGCDGCCSHKSFYEAWKIFFPPKNQGE